MKIVALTLAAGLAVGTLLSAPPASAGTSSVTMPLGTVEMTIDGGAFTEECTDFPYEVVVRGPSREIQWSADIDAERDGGGSVSDFITDYGSGTFSDDIMICSGDGAGSWTATVTVKMWDTLGSTPVFTRTMTMDFTISKATTTTTITRVNASSSRTKVKATVAEAPVAMFGDVTIKVKKPSTSWKTGGSGTVAEDGTFSVTIEKAYPAGTKFKAVFEGTDEATRSTSAITTI